MPTTRAGSRRCMLEVLDADCLRGIVTHLSLEVQMALSCTCKSCHSAAGAAVLDGRSRIVKVSYVDIGHKTVHVHLLVPFGIKFFYVDPGHRLMHEMRVLLRSRRQAWQMCDGSYNFILRMCDVAYVQHRIAGDCSGDSLRFHTSCMGSFGI